MNIEKNASGQLTFGTPHIHDISWHFMTTYMFMLWIEASILSEGDLCSQGAPWVHSSLSRQWPGRFVRRIRWYPMCSRSESQSSKKVLDCEPFRSFCPAPCTSLWRPPARGPSDVVQTDPLAERGRCSKTCELNQRMPQQRKNIKEKWIHYTSWTLLGMLYISAVDITFRCLRKARARHLALRAVGKVGGTRRIAMSFATSVGLVPRFWDWKLAEHDTFLKLWLGWPQRKRHTVYEPPKSKCFTFCICIFAYFCSISEQRLQWL